MAQQTETVPRAGGFIVSEAAGTRSRGTGTIVSGQDLAAGAVLGVITASGKFSEYDPGNMDGTETAVAILYDAVDASAADVDGATIIERDCEVNDNDLVWFAGATAMEKATGATELAAVGIIVRTSA